MKFQNGLVLWKEAPDKDWEPQTYYKVKIALFEGNCTHTAIMYTGFLNNGIPSGYSAVWSATYDKAIEHTSHYSRKFDKARVFKAKKLYSKK